MSSPQGAPFPPSGDGPAVTDPARLRDRPRGGNRCREPARSAPLPSLFFLILFLSRFFLFSPSPSLFPAFFLLSLLFSFLPFFSPPIPSPPLSSLLFHFSLSSSIFPLFFFPSFFSPFPLLSPPGTGPAGPADHQQAPDPRPRDPGKVPRGPGCQPGGKSPHSGPKMPPGLVGEGGLRPPP